MVGFCKWADSKVLTTGISLLHHDMLFVLMPPVRYSGRSPALSSESESEFMQIGTVSAKGSAVCVASSPFGSTEFTSSRCVNRSHRSGVLSAKVWESVGIENDKIWSALRHLAPPGNLSPKCGDVVIWTSPPYSFFAFSAVQFVMATWNVRVHPSLHKAFRAGFDHQGPIQLLVVVIYDCFSSAVGCWGVELTSCGGIALFWPRKPLKTTE